MHRALLLGALAACGACRDDAARPASTPAKPSYPGTLYVVEGDVLARYSGGVRVELGQGLFASQQALPDGRVVAIASRGDGSPDAEQLALIHRDGRIERVGPTAMQVRDPAVDPRGRWIVVAANLDGHSDIYRIELVDGGRTATRMTNDPQGNFHPAVLGDAIVYVSSRDGDSELYKGSQRLTAFHRDDWQPTPSPRGDTLAFLSDREGPPRIFLMSPDGTSLRRLTTRATGDESAPTWSPDGHLLAYTSGGRVVLHDMTTHTERLLTPEGSSDAEPVFSPDGGWLAVSRTRGTTSDVVLLPSAGGEPVALAQNARLPRWF